MADPVVIQMLKQKRAEISGVIAAYLAKIAQAKHDGLMASLCPLLCLKHECRILTRSGQSRKRFLALHRLTHRLGRGDRCLLGFFCARSSR